MTRLKNKKSKTKVGGVLSSELGMAPMLNQMTKPTNNVNDWNNLGNKIYFKTNDLIKIHLKKMLNRVRTKEEVELLPLIEKHLLFDNTPDESLPDYIAGNELDWNLWESWELLFQRSTYTMPERFNNLSGLSGRFFDTISLKPSKTHDYDLHKLFTDRHSTPNFAYSHFIEMLDSTTKQYRTLLGLVESKSQSNIEYAQKQAIDWGDKIFFIGDIHSAFHSLAYILFRLRLVNQIFEDETMILKENHYIVFTGDFVDYGSYGIETLWCLLTLKFNNPHNVIIINGNHEEQKQYSNKLQKGSTLLEEMETQVPEIKERIDNLLALLPMVVFLEKPDGSFYQTNHGAFCEKFAGYDNRTNTFKPDSNLHKFLKDTTINITYFQRGEGYSFLWGDFKYDKTRPLNKFVQGSSARQAYSANFTRKYCEEYNILSIISGHQDTLSIGIIPNRDIETIDSAGINKNHEIILRDETPHHKLQWYPADKNISYNYIDDRNLDDEPYDFNLKPFNEVVAIILSTATTMIKKCMFHSIGELHIEEDPEYVVVQYTGQKQKKKKHTKKRNTRKKKHTRKKRNTRKRRKRLR